MLRTLILVNLMGMAAAFVRVVDSAGIWQEMVSISLFLQPILLLSLILLCGLNKVIQRFGYLQGVVSVLILEGLVAVIVHKVVLARMLEYSGGGHPGKTVLLTLMVTGLMLFYFNLRTRILSPALGEARLQALQARIRPHFLFNSLNAVLSLVRSDPKRAERALEDLADLYRVLMADNRDLVKLEDEVSLCWQYLELEQLRLGDRLQITWHIDKMPPDALIPPLVLQPLLENAVYHGIEPSSTPGEISINIYQSRDMVHIVLRNPYQKEGNHHSGNKMALENIRERLALHFDAEATLKCEVSGNVYQVHIIIPYTKAKA